MLRIAPLLPLAAALALVPAATSFAATATFTGTFEAERSVRWDQPRGVNLIDCKGEHFYETGGSESWKVKTSKPFKVVAKGVPGAIMWTFGAGPMVRDPRMYGVEAAGMVKRDWHKSSGTTGGWCSPGLSLDPKPEDDCGTRLPRYLVTFSALRGDVDWSMHQAPWMDREKLDFYQCTLLVPTGLSVGSFPRLPAKLRIADIFNRRKGTLVAKAGKAYGPDTTMVPNFGVPRTASGKVSWKLTLKRTR